MVHARALHNVTMPSRFALLPVSAMDRAEWLDSIQPRALAPEQALAVCYGYPLKVRRTCRLMLLRKENSPRVVIVGRVRVQNDSPSPTKSNSTGRSARSRGHSRGLPSLLMSAHHVFPPH